jgi:hypothetical protein
VRSSVNLTFSVRAGFFWLLLVLAILWIAGSSSSSAQESTASEYEIKAAYLINFPKYAEWPAEAFAAADSPIVIAVLGETKMTEEVQKIIEDRTVNGRKIVLKHLAFGEDLGACHILFIPAPELQRSRNLLAKLKRGVLTIGESNDFFDQGGIINLALRNQTIELEVNLTAARNAGIKFSSKFLRLASIVKGQAK